MKPFFMLALLLLFSVASTAGEYAEKAINLSPNLRALLVEEMREVKKGMESLVTSIALGDWKAIEETGHNIKHSYIFKKRLTGELKRELIKVLPGGFKYLDKKFHYYAGMLSHVAKERDIDLVQFYRSKMNETCTACHARFASARFTSFTQKNKHEGHMH
jgi:hypothetical protein